MSADPRLTARRIVHLIQTHRIDVTTEDAAHRGILAVLAADMPDSRSEVRLSPKDRIDVLCGACGVEIKVAGSRRAIFDQLRRYAEHDAIQALVLATGIAWPEPQFKINEKPVLVASLSRGWL